MAKVQTKQTIDVFETLRTFEVLESLKFNENDINKKSFRTLMYKYLREGTIQGNFSVVSLPDNEYVVTRTA